MPRVNVNGVSLNVFDQGDGPVILFVHGFPLDHTMWWEQLEYFVQSHRVIAPDLRGFGQSDPFSGCVDMKDFADDLAELLSQLSVEGKICFCGLSMGGYIGWQFVARHANRLGSLIACDTRIVGDSPEFVNGRMKLAQLVIEQGPQAAADAVIPKLFSAKSLTERTAIVEETRRVILETDPESIAAALRGMANRPDMTSILPTINVPTLVMAGTGDVLSPPAEMRAFSEKIPGAQFVEILDAGHMAPLENPGAVNRALAGFLARV